jgi:O-antigen biosynthesis protein
MDGRPIVREKFLSLNGEKFFIKGITYGPFRPMENGSEYGTEESVRRDFLMMKEHGFNTVRTYTVPPMWLLDIAKENNLYIFVGLPWEQHITFLSDQAVVSRIKHTVRNRVRSIAEHPAIFGYAVGNEIPAPIVRWHGRRRIEKFIHQLYTIVKQEDPDGLVTYINYPTTEYLQLPFVDFHSYNVYLETPEKLTAYLARLQNIAGDKPLVLGELGLDSMRNGTEKQAEVLSWQIETAFNEGSAGVFVFSWTDEWYRGGHEIDDWAFGLTQRDRTPKPALFSVSEQFSNVPFKNRSDYPHISVVVCTYNGAATLQECCEGLRNLNYPNYEVIVVNDGSKDKSESIARKYGFKTITIENGGLSNARNIGWRAASGDIVAYIDDDAWPDPDWLHYLAHTYMTTDFAAVGGTNIGPDDDGMIAEAVDHSPGGPTHVLINDRVAEHIPGCNMSFRKECLEAIGGFDTQFKIAGDDVDICWRIQERGWKIGFNAAAMVWHHRRNSVKRYLKQQYNYGKAEAMLEEKWPEKYNTIGHLTWKGRIYGKGLTPALLHKKSIIYQGIWGTAPFQRLYEPSLGRLTSLPLMPEGYVLIASFFILSLFGLLWEPLLIVVPFLFVSIGVAITQALIAAYRPTFPKSYKDKIGLFKKRSLIAFLHLAQPFVRLLGRVSKGLTPWRFRGKSGWTFPINKEYSLWSEEWRSPEEWLSWVEDQLKRRKIVNYRGGDYDKWDIGVAGGMFGAARLFFGLEEHGGAKQNLKWRILPVISLRSILAITLLGGVAIISAFDHAWLVSGLFILLALIPFVRWLIESGQAIADFQSPLMGIADNIQQRFRIDHAVQEVYSSFIGDDEMITENDIP